MIFLILCSLIAIGIFAHAILRKFEQRNEERFCRQITEALETIVSALRAGASFLHALKLSLENAEEPFLSEFSQVFQEYQMGIPFEKSLENLAQRQTLEDIQSLVAAVRISQASGGSLAGVLDKLAKNLRRQQQIKNRVESLSAQGKMQGNIMAVIPLLLLMFFYFIQPELMQSFIHSGFGKTILCFVLLAEVLAFWVVQSLLQIKV